MRPNRDGRKRVNGVNLLSRSPRNWKEDFWSVQLVQRHEQFGGNAGEAGVVYIVLFE